MGKGNRKPIQTVKAYGTTVDEENFPVPLSTNGDEVKVSSGFESVLTDAKLGAIIDQMKIMNMHLFKITGLVISESRIGDL